MGNRVVAVEPFNDNILRIHKSAYLEKTYNNIVLVKNAISDKRNEVKILSKFPTNVGTQSLIHRKVITDAFPIQKNEIKKYSVTTILFDDIVPFIPLKTDESGEQYNKAVLKIDIEGYEPYAFQHANLLFDKFDIQFIFMEWAFMKEEVLVLGDDYREKINYLIDFLFNRHYRPYSDYYSTEMLLRDDWSNWTFDIFWKKLIF